MTRRRDLLACAVLGSAFMVPCRAALAAGECSDAAAQTAGSALLDRYVAAVNAHDTSPFPELFTETYIQHSGRSPSGLAAQIENFRRIIASMPDVQVRVEDRIVTGDKAVARNTYSATHTQTIRGIAPTGKRFSFRTIDIWRVERGKLAEHWDLTDAAEVIAKLRDG
jgi:predicted ester cyclase